MGFNQRNANPLDFNTSPTLPQADSSQDHDIPTGVSPTTAKLQDWIAGLDQGKVTAQIDDTGILALLNEELTDYAAHRASAVFHNPADTTNTVSTAVVTTIPLAIPRANLLKAALRAHMLNTGGSYHDATDTTNESALGAIADATDVQSLRALVVAIKTYYNAHRTQSGVHPTNDTTNIVTTADPDATTISVGIAISDIQEFTSSGTWTKPTSFTPQWVDVELIGGGGAGGSGPRRAGGVDSSGGASGSGAGVTRRRLLASLLGATEAVTIGAGGNGGSAITVNDTNGNAGANGSASTFGSWLKASGGLGGAGGFITAGDTATGSGARADFFGGDGAPGTTGAAGNTPFDSAGAAGGGSGGGIGTSGTVAEAGGAGAVNAGSTSSAAAGGAATGVAGTTGGESPTSGPGRGGGGGGGSTVGTGGNGGSGGGKGGGGGGGGASQNGSNSGAGGNGGTGYCRVISVP